MDELAALQASAATEFSYMGAPAILLTGENIHGSGISSGLSESLSDLASTPISDGSKGTFYFISFCFFKFLTGCFCLLLLMRQISRHA